MSKREQGHTGREEAARIRCGRKGLGLTIAEAAASLGVSGTTLKRWEAGKATPGPTSVDQMLAKWGLATDHPLRQGLVDDVCGRRLCWSLESREVRPVLRLLRHRRRRSGLTLDEVSAASGVAVPSLQRYETGTRLPSEDVLRSLCGAVGCRGQEFDLLRESLATSDPQVTPFQVTQLFSSAGHNPGFWIFRELDFLSRFHSTQPAQELEARLRSCLMGLAFAGDYAALLEAWGEMRGLLRKGNLFSPLNGMVAMAKMHLARRPREAASDFVNLRRQAPREMTSDDQVSATFSLIRMAQLLNEHEDADDLLRRIEEHRDMTPEKAVSCIVYRLLVDHAVGESQTAATEMQNLRRSANPVLSYTTKVAELSIRIREGNRLAAGDLHEDCLGMEGEYGLGSPLAKRLAAGLRAC